MHKKKRIETLVEQRLFAELEQTYDFSDEVVPEEIKNLVQEEVDSFLSEAKALITQNAHEFSVISSKLGFLTSKTKQLERMFNENVFNRSFLELSKSIYHDLFGQEDEVLPMVDLDLLEFNDTLPLHQYILKFRVRMLEDDDIRSDEKNRMNRRNKIFYSSEYDAITNMAYAFSEALESLADFNDNKNKFYYDNLEKFFTNYRVANNLFVKFYKEHKPRFQDEYLEEKDPNYIGQRNNKKTIDLIFNPQLDKIKNSRHYKNIDV